MDLLILRPPPRLEPAASARVDLLRLILIAQVVLGHLAMIAFPSFGTLQLSDPADAFVAGWRLLTRFGPEAAIVFVGMSGYFLAPRLLAIGMRDAGAEPLVTFVRGRLKRIYPTLVAALLLTLACDLAGVRLLDAEPLYRRVASYDAVATLNPQVALANLLSLQPTFSPSFGSNGPLWTLGYIVQFYVVAGLLAGLMRWQRRLAGAALVLLLAGSYAFRPEWSMLFACWLGCGMLRWVRPLPAMTGWLAIVAGTGLMVAANLMAGQPKTLACSIAGGLLLLGMTATIDLPRLRVLPRWMVRLNAASYPLYAFHYPLALVVFAGLAPHFDTAALSVRVAWPIVTICFIVAVSLPFQSLLDRRSAGRAR